MEHGFYTSLLTSPHFYLAKLLQGQNTERWLVLLEPLLMDQDSFKQRAGTEVLAGLSRGKHSSWHSLRAVLWFCTLGSKHWPKNLYNQLWQWIISRLDHFYSQIKPDTISLWESVFTVSVYLHVSSEIIIPRRSKFTVGTSDESQV